LGSGLPQSITVYAQLQAQTIDRRRPCQPFLHIFSAPAA
jgi:hypothetical protein